MRRKQQERQARMIDCPNQYATCALCGQHHRKRPARWFFYDGLASFNAIALCAQHGVAQWAVYQADGYTVLVNGENFLIPAVFIRSEDNHGTR